MKIYINFRIRVSLILLILIPICISTGIRYDEDSIDQNQDFYSTTDRNTDVFGVSEKENDNDKNYNGINSELWQNLTCEDVNDIPQDLQCEFVSLKCDDFKIGKIDYISFYYCYNNNNSNNSNKILKETFLLPTCVLILTILFISIGLTASDFLCPNLSSISNFLGIPENLSGLTLLAFGNGSPDIMGTFTSFQTDNASLAIGELIGAAFFITSVVIGSMAIIKPFRVLPSFKEQEEIRTKYGLDLSRNDKYIFIRDLSFFIISVLIVIIFLSDGQLTILECSIMVVIYTIYVLVVVYWNWWTNSTKTSALDDIAIFNRFNDGLNSSNDFFRFNNSHEGESNGINNDDFDIQESFSGNSNSSLSFPYDSLSLNNTYKNSILSTIEFGSIFNNLQAAQSIPTSLNYSLAKKNTRISNSIGLTDIEEGSRYSDTANSNSNQSDVNANDDYHDNRLMNELDDQTRADQAHLLERQQQKQQFLSESFDFTNINSLNTAPTDTNNENENTGLSNGNKKLIVFNKYRKLFEEIIFKILRYFSSPLKLILMISIPVQSESDFNNDTKPNFNKLFCILISLLLTPFLLNTAFLQSEGSNNFITLILLNILTIYLTFMTYINLIKPTNELPNYINYLRLTISFIGFINSISWISLIAEELINVLKFISIFIDVSDTILGLTLFAIGNSIGDMISNITIAKMGFPLMSLAACIGGPLLNLLLGIGVDGLVVLLNSSNGINELKFDLNLTLYISIFCFLTNLCFILVYVPLNSWRIDKNVGLTLIGIWSFGTTICILIELFN
ncbi:hypothetical protein BVG19_g1980 [[Candida] boidinii]|nr:hypothetical protein BVG19_g1980 [[Candida] boidinii]OWB49419.1 hypothetical protein B5S27_g960 [[Candida] boidinii]